MSGSRQSHNSQAVGRKRDEGQNWVRDPALELCRFAFGALFAVWGRGIALCSPPTTGAAPQPINHPIFSFIKSCSQPDFAVLWHRQSYQKVMTTRLLQSNLLSQATIFAYTSRQFCIQVLVRMVCRYRGAELVATKTTGMNNSICCKR